MLYGEMIKEILAYYEGLEKRFKAIVRNSPPGGIICQKDRNRTQLLHMYRSGGNRRGMDRPQPIRGRMT